MSTKRCFYVYREWILKYHCTDTGGYHGYGGDKANDNIAIHSGFIACLFFSTKKIIIITMNVHNVKKRMFLKLI